MINRGNTLRLLLAGWLAMTAMLPANVQAAKVRLKNGQVLSGDVANIKTMVEESATGPGGPDNNAIVMVDDGLRRTFVSLHQVQEIINAAPDPEELFVLQHHRYAKAGKMFAAMGANVKTSPWSEFGRRRMTIFTGDGAKNIVQGISQITPRHYEVRSLYAEAADRLLLDQRYATSSMPSSVIRKILYKSIDLDDADERLRVAEFFLQGRRYRDAENELKTIEKKFPNIEGLDRLLKQMQQLKAREALVEIKRRQRSGQNEFALRILNNFPAEGIAGETLFEVRELIDNQRKNEQRLEKLRSAIGDYLTKVENQDHREKLGPIVEEISSDLRTSNVGRLAAFTRLSSDKTLSAAEKLSLAASGWLVGVNEATTNIGISLSLFEVRDMIRKYLNEPIKGNRINLLTAMSEKEGSAPRYVDKIVEHMTPAWPTGAEVEEEDGLYEITVPGRGRMPDVTYQIQVPPEYDPYRRYPAVVTLHGVYTTPEQQIDWWAGGRSKNGMRLGQGTRHGYIVIAPKWAREDQRSYQYSGREHLAVLDALRDATRRFSIDADRVFLSGHGMGGDAAWDMGIAHPDLWAGVIPIVAEVDSNRYNYNARYWRNAKQLPLYFVGGTLDGMKSLKNAPQYDRYLGRVGYQATIVEYLGRGQESYIDEVQRIFEWMNLQQRDFHRSEIAATTFRSFDNFFWYLEVDQFRDGQVMDPEDWTSKGGASTKLKAVINKDGKGKTFVRVQSAAERMTVWLSPELVDFNNPITVSVRNLGRVRNPKPSIEALLEDVRTRGDRQHPFWARIEFGGE